MLYQLAAAEVDGQHFAVVALGIANPFLVGGRMVACKAHAAPLV